MESLHVFMHTAILRRFTALAPQLSRLCPSFAWCHNKDASKSHDSPSCRRRHKNRMALIAPCFWAFAQNYHDDTTTPLIGKRPTRECLELCTITRRHAPASASSGGKSRKWIKTKFGPNQSSMQAGHTQSLWDSNLLPPHHPRRYKRGLLHLFP